MYSRNTSKNGYFSHKNPPVKQHRTNNVVTQTVPDPVVERDTERPTENVRPNNVQPTPERAPLPQTQMPAAPPNYRGMIYEMEQMIEPAEGIDRLVRNDSSYNDYERRLRRRDYMQGRVGEAPAFSHTKPEKVCCEKSQEKTPERNGLQSIIDGLRDKKLQPEDILICALIILMLNSSSEDDILMVLALMMLL